VEKDDQGTERKAKMIKTQNEIHGETPKDTKLNQNPVKPYNDTNLTPLLFNSCLRSNDLMQYLPSLYWV
jgi:hypothetical protein